MKRTAGRKVGTRLFERHIPPNDIHNIVGFLDSNPHYTGKQLAGRLVSAPQDVERLEAQILVASAVSQTAISAAARDRFGPDVPLILLY